MLGRRVLGILCASLSWAMVFAEASDYHPRSQAHISLGTSPTSAAVSGFCDALGHGNYLVQGNRSCHLVCPSQKQQAGTVYIRPYMDCCPASLCFMVQSLESREGSCQPCSSPASINSSGDVRFAPLLPIHVFHIIVCKQVAGVF
jgi:hypothetical protein